MLHGCDISHYQGRVDFGQFKKDYKFVYIKATEGVNHVDKMFPHNWSTAYQVGLPCGAYHFFHPSQDVGDQAANFCRAVGKLRKGDLPPALDWEITNNVDPATQKAAALKWLQQVETGLGMKPIIYLSPGFAAGLGDLKAFKDYHLWIAHYGVQHPKIPAPWTEYTFWQHTGAGGLDKNWFNGDDQALQSMTYQAMHHCGCP